MISAQNKVFGDRALPEPTEGGHSAPLYPQLVLGEGKGNRLTPLTDFRVEIEQFSSEHHIEIYVQQS